jgi:hypothetical protein
MRGLMIGGILPVKNAKRVDFAIVAYDYDG